MDYHKETNKILIEFNMYVEYFNTIAKNINPDYRERLIREHKQLIKSIDKSTKEEFSKVASEVSLIE
jgi:preprotein translocase subunit Sss1